LFYCLPYLKFATNVKKEKKGYRYPENPLFIYDPEKKESVNETWNQLRTNLISILKRKQHQKIDGVLVDMQTANVILKVWDALNSSNRKKFEKLPVKKMANVAWKLVS